MILAEVVVGAAILVVFISGLVLSQKIFITQSSMAIERAQAALIAEEGIEIVKHFRDESWDAFYGPGSNGTYGFAWDTNWATTSSAEVIDDKFFRSFSVEDVSRDGSFNIVTSGGTVDPNTKKITVTVEWSRSGATTTKTMATYITNIHEE